MIYYYTDQKVFEQDIWAGKKYCQQCGNYEDFHLYKLKHKAKLFFIIPIISVTRGRYLICDNCGSMKQLTAEESKNIKREQFDNLARGEFPDNVVLNECNPKASKFNKQLIKLIVSGMFFL